MDVQILSAPVTVTPDESNVRGEASWLVQCCLRLRIVFTNGCYAMSECRRSCVHRTGTGSQFYPSTRKDPEVPFFKGPDPPTCYCAPTNYHPRQYPIALQISSLSFLRTIEPSCDCCFSQATLPLKKTARLNGTAINQKVNVSVLSGADLDQLANLLLPRVCQTNQGKKKKKKNLPPRKKIKLRLEKKR
ncbi:hypothetical protein LZ32DRAFT_336367 [Colletotrichum eremochloae]|nr:hypothetical protein LZ32DRAFT_336367 [Colletotrichum eremochloae]